MEYMLRENRNVSSRFFPRVGCTLMFSLILHGMFPHKEQLCWPAFLSPSRLTSQPCWSCCVTSVPLTPCWGAAWLRGPVQVGGCSCDRIISNMEEGMLPRRLVMLLLYLCCVLLYFCEFPPASVCDLHFEVRPEYTTSISVTFRQPHIDRLAVCKHFFKENFMGKKSHLI